MAREYPRSFRVADQIQRELSTIVTQELKDPGIGEFFTISEVEVTRDLSIADVHFTVLDAQSVPATLAALRRASGFLRRRLAGRVRLRVTPQLRFHHDSSTADGARMDALIAAARRRDRDDD